MKYNGLLKFGMVWVLIFLLTAVSFVQPVSLEISAEKVSEIGFPQDASKGFDDSYYLQEAEDIALVVDAVNQLELKNEQYMTEENLTLEREDCAVAVFFIYYDGMQEMERFLIATGHTYGILITKDGHLISSHVNTDGRYYKHYEIEDYSQLLEVLDTMREKHKEQAEMFPYW